MTRYRITIELDYPDDTGDMLPELRAHAERLLEDGELDDPETGDTFDTYDLRVEVVEPPKENALPVATHSCFAGVTGFTEVPFGPSDGEAREAERQVFERERHLQGLTVASPHALSQLVESMRASQGTWLQSEEYAGPRNAYNRKGEALLFDGSVRAVRAKLPDTAMSIPAYYIRKGRRVHGYLTYTDGVYRFHEQEKP